MFLLIDCRHGLKPPDREIMEMLDEAAVSYQVVLTKADKINERAREVMRRDTEKALATHPAAFPRVLVDLVGKGRRG